VTWASLGFGDFDKLRAGPWTLDLGLQAVGMGGRRASPELGRPRRPSAHGLGRAEFRELLAYSYVLSSREADHVLQLLREGDSG
jgi:hypothetical protein